MREAKASTRRRTRERIVTLNDPHAMRINKELAEEIGFQESVVFLQVEFLVSTKGELRDGRRWVRLPLEELRDEHMPWWSVSTLSRVLHRLEERSLILVDQGKNREGRDRRQWLAVDEEGVKELRSIAILQIESSGEQEEPEAPNLQDETPDPAENRQIAECNVQAVNLQDASRQNASCIYMETSLSEKVKETPPEGGSKKPAVSSPLPQTSGRKTRISKLDDAEAERLLDELCEGDPNGDAIRSLAALLAEENATGKVAVTRVWREIGERYVRAKERETLSDEAWAYGFEQALSRSAPNIGYVLSAARGYRPPRLSVGASPRARGGRSGVGSKDVAVIGATEEAYDGDF